MLLVVLFALFYFHVPARIMLIRNQNKWASHAVKNYNLSVNEICLCAYNEPKVLEVRDGKPVAPVEPAWQQIESIDELFKRVQGGIDNHVAILTVDYDETYGYPSEVYMKWHFLGFDDNVTYRVTSFEPLP